MATPFSKQNILDNTLLFDPNLISYIPRGWSQTTEPESATLHKFNYVGGWPLKQ